MEYRAIVLAKKWGFLALLILLCGCANRLYVDEYSNQWISRPLSELQQAMNRPDSYASKIQWKETTYPLANGYHVFVEPLSKECSVHWNINPRDKIVGYHAVGSGCEQKKSDDSLQTITPRSSAGW
jgi:hypothetical protein